MSISTDATFLSEISIYLPLFKWQRSGNVAKCRCILCGDSKKDHTKTRGFFYPDEENSGLQYKCHNCGKSMSFSWFLKTQFPETYREYRLTRFRERGSRKRETVKEDHAPAITIKPAPKKPDARKSWVYVNTLPDDHPAKVYCRSRMLKDSHMKRIVFADCFKKWSEENFPEVDMYPPEGPRIIFPFIDESGHCFGAQGRIFVESEKSDRFKSVMEKNSKRGKIFGLETVNKNLPVLVVEGVIDSIFLPNCVALCGGDVNISFKDLSPMVIIILDNEPRNQDTINRLSKAIYMGFRVVIWPLDSKYKDINDMVKKAGMSVKEILTVISENSFSGAKAKAKLTFWKKI